MTDTHPPAAPASTSRPGRRGPRPPRPPSEPGFAARRAALTVLDAILIDGQSLDTALDGAPIGALDERDRGLVRALVGTTLRRLGSIDKALKSRLDRPLPHKAERARTILRLMTAQILFMDVPDHAAVSLGVALARADARLAPWVGLVNAVGRGIAANAEMLRGLGDDPSLDLPLWLMRRWTEIYGADIVRRSAALIRHEPPLDLTPKGDGAALAERLGGRLLPTGTVRLTGAGLIERLPGYEAGEWWVQDAAAALPARLLGDVAGKRVADLCAAPGGKTAQLALAGARVTAVDQSAPRLKRLTANLARLHLSAEVVSADLTRWAPPEPFDAILLDAPCSATGTLRRHPDAGRLKRASDVAALAELQTRLLERAAGWLKPGGRLVYATCSLEPEEGEARIAAFLATHPDFHRVPVTAAEIGGLTDAITAEGDLRTLPCHLRIADDPALSGLDGFFAARLERRA
ncbi:RsmB/NOP family class I SAM-dependent RNA methyltransferase [Segnochrobactraceae bacterium EtOH-i3]